LLQMGIYIYICCHFKRKMEAQAIFLNPFTVCSSCNWKFVICPFVDKEINGSYPFSNRLNGLSHLWLYRSWSLWVNVPWQCLFMTVPISTLTHVPKGVLWFIFNLQI
jgi:hypothetical protein